MKLLWLVTFLLVTPLLRAQELRILESDSRGLTVEYRPAVVRVAVRSNGMEYARFDFSAAVPDAAAEPGLPDIKVRSELLALPAFDGNRVTVLQSEYRDESGVTAAPVPSFRDTEDGEEIVYRQRAGYDGNGFLPAAPARLADIGVARDRILANLLLAPVQWDAARRLARIHTRLLVRVDYGNPVGGLSSAADRRGPSVPVLNGDASSAWFLRPPTALRKTRRASLAAGEWYRIDIADEGMYKLPKAWFTAAGIEVSSIDPRTIRLYGSGGRELPSDLNAPRPDDMQETAIRVVGEEDGRFDDNDYVVFHARGISGFRFDSTGRRFAHVIHRFAKTNSYLLTFGGDRGLRMQDLASLNEPGAYRPAWFTGREFVEPEEVNFLFSGMLWIGRRIAPGTTGATYMKVLDQIEPSEPVVYRMQLYSQSESSNHFTVSDEGTVLGTVPMGISNLDDEYSNVAVSSGVKEFRGSGALPGGRSTLTFVYSAADLNRTLGGYVDWIEWHYAHRFVPTNDALGFTSPDTSATIAYELNGFTNSDVSVYDVTEYANARRMSGVDVSGGTVRFQAAVSGGSPRQYAAVTSGALKIPSPPVKLRPSSLHESAGAELVIITSDELLEAAGRLRAHREQPGPNRMTAMTVSVTDIYTEFSSGVTDPTAIRNFLAYAMRSWQVKPTAVLLFGDGHYDYKNITTPEQIIVPPWESANSTVVISTFPTDDYYAMVLGRDANGEIIPQNDNRVDFGLGRLPVLTPEQAATVVDKIISYESRPEYSLWKNTLTFVADDGLTSKGDEGNMHTKQSEDIANSLPPSVQQKKIYIVSFPTENTAQGRRKPLATAAIMDRLNEGTLMMNWTGHGSESVWAHEQVLTKGMVPELRNADRLSFITAATCTFGLYDRPGDQSGTELFILQKQGGAVGGVSAPRVVFSDQNSAFNITFYDQAVNRGREADGRVKTLGDVMFATKQIRYGTDGYLKFHLFADPSMRLAFPRYSADVDSILVNGMLAQGDSTRLKALSRVTIHGSVLRADNSLWDDFSGTMQVNLFDARRAVPVPEWNNWTYTIDGGILYRGQSSVKGGRFTSSFIVPKDIMYENNSGRLTLYFDNAQSDGTGFTTNFIIGGSDTTAATDTKGPDIALFMDTRSFRSGDLVSENSTLIADLFDENGINTTGLGIGHNIEAWIDGAETGVILNEYYKGEKDSYQKGVVEYPFRGLAPGTHTLRLRAWDIFNNSNVAETYFTVASSDALAVRNVFNFPNPFRDNTVFTFQHNLAEAVNVEIKVYTIAGTLVRRIEQRAVSERFVRIPWDGRDGDGSILSNGVYFYKLICSSADGSRGSETVGKLSVLR